MSICARLLGQAQGGATNAYHLRTGIAAVLVSGCAAQPNIVWLRTDGQRMTGNAALSQQLDVDKTVCQGEGQKANMSGTQIDTGNPIIDGISAAKR
jgi:hypothetical protein